MGCRQSARHTDVQVVWRMEEAGEAGIDREGHIQNMDYEVDLRELTKLARPSVPREGHWRQEGGVTQALTEREAWQE